MSPRTKSWLVGVSLSALCVISYGRLGGNDFIDLDDEVYITNNPAVKGGLTPRGVAWAWSTFHAGFYQPLTWMSLQLDASLFTHAADGKPPTLNAAGFHLHNLLWHAAT